ncbi:hypothetical protein Cni_G22989 [Canna indica]|uniref:Protein kinase domain-containing protein n=1 Tax=Canna indica TaxID=4628 RepID=A0AAQ3KTA5_9LILI|nr:hypothetical protein Cni_G22989 [Canna indica]
MEHLRNSQKLQYDSPETRNTEFVTSNTARHALNYSIQTGEEFSFEFMRDKAVSKRPSIPNTSAHQIISSNQVDLRRRRAVSNAARPGNESTRCRVVEHRALSNVEKKTSTETDIRDYLALTRTYSQATAGDSSYRGFHPRHSSSEPTPTIVKFLCSYGGKFLPRPSDAKLRYVGGDTRILRIRKTMSWKEFMQRVRMMYIQTCTIKYQLPGDDIDALVSVFSDEDFQHMIDECIVLEQNVASQKPRMFLFSSDDDNINAHFTLGTMEGDFEAHYISAVNDLDLSVEFTTSQMLGSTSTGELDQSLILNHEIGRVKPSLTGSEIARTVSPEAVTLKTPSQGLSSTIQENLSSDSDIHPQCEDRRRRNAEQPCSSILYDNTFNSDENVIPIPSSMPSEYDYLARSATACETSLKPVHQQIIPHLNRAEEFSGVIISQGQNVAKKEVKPMLQGLSQHADATTEHQLEHRFPSPVQQHGVSLSYSRIETPYGFNGPDFISPNHQMKCLESQELLLLDNVNGGTSAGGVTTECSVYKPKVAGLIPEDPHSQLSSLFYKDEMLLKQDACGHEENIVTLVSDVTFSEADNKTVRKNYDFQRKVNKTERNYSTSSLTDGKNNLNQGRIWNGSDRNRSIESSSSDGKTYMPKVCSQVLLGDGLEATKSISPSSSIGSILKQKESPTLLSIKLGQEEITTKVATHLLVDKNAGVVSQEHYNLPATEQSEPLNSSNSLFFPDIVSNSISKVRTSEELSNISTCSNHDMIIGLKMTSNENQSSLVNPLHNELTRKDVALGRQHYANDTPLMAQDEVALLDDRVVLEQKNIHVDFSEVESSLANVGENLRTALLEYEENAYDKKEANDPGSDASMKVPNITNVQIINNEDLEELQELGSGTFGTVYHGKWRGTDVAIKRIKSSYFTGQPSQTDKMILGFWREVSILSKLHHPNVVAFYGVVKDEPGGALATVTEYMSHGSLKHVLQRKERHLDFRKRLLIAMDAAIGMEYLHSRNIVHFDLKCDNLLVNLKDPSRPICKVCDFGLSKMKPNTMVSGGVRGTLPWMAPELLYISGNKVSEKIDVYSFGIVMWEILTGEEPYADMHYGEVIGGLLHNTLRPPVPASCDRDWRSLMEKCWAADPAQRPTFTEIASNLKSIYKCRQSRACS